MAARHEETVGKKIQRMLAQFILIDNRDRKLAMPEIEDGCADNLIAIISGYPLWVARRLIPPLARAIMKDKVRGIRDSSMPLLPGFEGLNLGFRFAVPPTKVVEENVEEIDEESSRTVWVPRHIIEVGEYRRHVASYTALLSSIQYETDLRNQVLMRAEELGGGDEEVLIEVLGRGDDD